MYVRHRLRTDSLHRLLGTVATVGNGTGDGTDKSRDNGGGREGRGGAGGGQKTQSNVGFVPAFSTSGSTTNNITNINIAGVAISNAPDSVRDWLIETAQRKNINNRGVSFNRQ